jgi:transcriptional regulator with XRE-family HTH domain
MIEDPASLVSERLKAERSQRGLTLRELAAASSLSANTINLIERGKISPTVATLHKLAVALGVTIADFVQKESDKQVIFFKEGQRQRARSVKVLIESLGTGLADQMMEPLLITLEPGADSGPDPIVHIGHELIYCLYGRIMYDIRGEEYLLEPGDSLFFEASLPHRWRNELPTSSRALLIMQSTDIREDTFNHHFYSL